MKTGNKGAKNKFISVAFSLVELMMVVSILALLIGLISLGVSRHRQRAIMISCQNNLRQHVPELTEAMIDLQTASGSSGYGGMAWQKGAGDTIRVGGVDYTVLDVEGMLGGRWAFATEGSGSSRSRLIDAFRYCPAVDAEWSFDPDDDDPDDPSQGRWSFYSQLIDPDSPRFKGYGPSRGALQFAESTGRITGGRTDSELTAVDTYIETSTYAISTTSLHANAVAMIDWNAEEGWGGDLYSETWGFRNPSKGIEYGTPKNDDWWKTEVGFHHLGGANYITWGGSGGWVHSNEISRTNFYPEAEWE